MCINDTVLKLGSIQLVNDRCIELQKTKSKTIGSFRILFLSSFFQILRKYNKNRLKKIEIRHFKSLSILQTKCVD